MYSVDVYLRVRRAVMVEGLSVREAARTFGLHRDTVRKMLEYSVPPGYRRQVPPRSFLAPLASSARMLPMAQPARTSRSTCMVQILVLGLPGRDPGVAVQRHPGTSLAVIPEVKDFANGFSSHRLSYGVG